MQIGPSSPCRGFLFAAENPGFRANAIIRTVSLLTTYLKLSYARAWIQQRKCFGFVQVPVVPALLSNMRAVLVILVVVATACCSFSSVRALTPVTPWEQGFATYVGIIAYASCTCMHAFSSAARAPWAELCTDVGAIVLHACRFYGGHLAGSAMRCVLYAAFCACSAPETRNTALCVVLQGPYLTRLRCMVCRRPARWCTYCSVIAHFPATACPCTCLPTDHQMSSSSTLMCEPLARCHA